VAAIETARLLLRPFTMEDVQAYAAIRANPRVMRFFPPTGETPTESARRLVGHFMGHWRDTGYGLYMLDDAVWGRGYATEGAAAARDFAFDRLGLNRIMAIALPENRASTRVMEKIGLRYERMAPFRGRMLAYYALDRPAR
jgi:RimJ/RimL family protein N-acetyltransferase